MGYTHCTVHLWTGSCTCACSCMLSQTTAGKSLLSHSFSLLCSGSPHLYFEMHMSAVTQHVPILSDLSQARRNAHSLNFKKPEESGLGPSKVPLGSPCEPPLSGRVLTQFRLDSDSSIDSAGLADPYLCQNTDLCPLFHPVSFSLNNGELACPTVWCSTNTTSLTCSACL